MPWFAPLTGLPAATPQPAPEFIEPEPAPGDEQVKDIDANLEQDVVAFADYAPVIYDHFKTLEQAYDISADYMTSVQAEISPAMRAVLVDWLVEVVEEYRLMPETLYMAVQYIDRYLTVRSVSRNELQLVGISALLLACKMEEIYTNMVDELVTMSDNTYARADIIRMELDIVSTLQWKTKCATARTFLHRYCTAAGASRGDVLVSLVKFLIECTCIEYRFLQFRPSQITAAAVLLARKLIGKARPWTATLQHYTGYSAEELEACVTELAHAHKDMPFLRLRAIYEKYTHAPYHRVARTIPPLVPVTHGSDGRTPELRSCAAGLEGNVY